MVFGHSLLRRLAVNITAFREVLLLATWQFEKMITMMTLIAMLVVRTFVIVLRTMSPVFSVLLESLQGSEIERRKVLSSVP